MDAGCVLVVGHDSEAERLGAALRERGWWACICVGVAEAVRAQHQVRFQAVVICLGGTDPDDLALVPDLLACDLDVPVLGLVRRGAPSLARKLPGLPFLSSVEAIVGAVDRAASSSAGTGDGSDASPRSLRGILVRGGAEQKRRPR